MSNVAAEEYASSLSDLTVNSKPLINMLTMLAEDNIEHAPAIVQAVEKHLQKVPSDIKLPVLYLIDSIVKNVGHAYVTLFTQNIVSTFCSVFEKVDEKTRAQMFKLRQTWNDVFPAKKLYAVDVRVSSIDPAWPITAPVPTSIHVNPKFLSKVAPRASTVTQPTPPTATTAVTSRKASTSAATSEAEMREQLLKKQKELLELQQRKLELELLQTKARLEEQQKQLERQTGHLTVESGTAPVLVPAIKDGAKKVQNNSGAKPTIVHNNSAEVNAPEKMPATKATRSKTNSRNSRDPRLARTRAAEPATTTVTITTTTTTTTTAAATPVTSTVLVNSTTIPRIPKEARTSSSRKDHRTPEPQQLQPAASSKIESSRTTQRSKGIKNQAPQRVAKNGESNLQPQALPPSDVPPIRPSPKKRERERERDREVSHPGPLPELAEPDVSASPSPPPATRTTAASSTTFKEVKSSRKGRSFRKRREGSGSPSPPVAVPQPQPQPQQQHQQPQKQPLQQRPAPSADVDLRGPPPDKMSRLSLSPKPAEPHVNAETKDVDLRPLSRASPSKKRQSAERSEQPPHKKSKAEMIDVLFGSEDVDLRTLVPIAVAPLPPSPPPPPVISHPSPPPPPVVTAPQPSPPPATPVMPAAAAGQGDEGAIGWAQLKESRPDAYKSHALPPPSPQQAQQLPVFGRPLFDRLGRPLLYRRHPAQSHEEQRHIMVSGEDTDMRMPRIDGDMDLNVNMIIAQAEEQLKNGIISFKEYNTLLKQVIHINEIQKLREAQRRDEQEDKENWGEMGRGIRRAHNASPLANDANHDARASPPSGRFGDIDERFPAAGPTLPPPPPPQWAPRPPTWTEHPPWGPRGVQGPPPPVSSAPPLHHQPPPPPSFRRPPDFGPPPFRWRQYGPTSGPGHAPRASFERQDDLHRFDRFPGGRFTRPPPLPPPHHPQPHPQMTQPPLQQQQQQLHPPSASCGGELPPADPLLLDLVAQDSMRTINIDGVPREIRFYGDTAVVLMAWDDPREISFQGGTRRVTFDDRDSVVCSFNEPYRDFTLDGQTHRIRLGAPTRELYIDGKWYECFFGGPPVNVDIGGKIRSVRLEGPPPQVKIGYVKRTDLVAGKINLIINARTMVPVFLDAKPQRFDIENKAHVLRFVDALRTVLINGRPFEVEFGGLPKPIMVRGKKHFVRFSVLPAGVRPGHVNIVNMEGRRATSPDKGQSAEDTAEVLAPLQPLPTLRQGHAPVLPMLGGTSRSHKADQEHGRDSPESSNARNSPAVNSTSGADTMQQALSAQGQMPLEMLTSLIPASMAPAAASGVGYRVEQETTVQQQSQQPPQLSTSLSLADINVEELFRKLVATGIVPAGPSPTGGSAADEKRAADDSSTTIRPVDFSQPETLKVRQPALVTQLYSGIQCSSCGVRFPPEQTMKYSQHLDWHFRQNRRERDSTRKAQSRKWYYDVSDWIQFEEIEDLEERAQSWFETQQAGGSSATEEVATEIPSVAVEGEENAACEVCHDRFEQFYNEEREEWHLRMAIRVDGHVYHPLCYEDLKASEAAAAEEVSSAAEDAENLESGTNLEEDGKTGDSDKPEAVKVESSSVIEEGKTLTDEQNGDSVVNVKEEKQTTEVKQELMETEEQSSTEPTTTSEDTKIEEEEKGEQKIVQSEDAEGVEDETDVSVQPLPVVDTTLAAVACSIDGNVQFEDPPPQPPALATGRIKINIGKTTAVSEPVPSPPPAAAAADGPAPACETPEPPPPGVEPVSLKPLLVGRKMTELPPVARGTELSGLCSIM